MYTTLNEIMKHNPCGSGWRRLLKGLGKTGPDAEPLSLRRILEINGLEDALWALRGVEGVERSARLFACDCAARVAHLNPDLKLQACINVARKFANGQATTQALAAARSAARSAAESAARSAAESAAMWTAAESAAESAARSAAESAAESAAWDAALAAAESAAESAAWDAARSAAWDAALAAARAAERTAQAELFIQYFCSNN